MPVVWHKKLNLQWSFETQSSYMYFSFTCLLNFSRFCFVTELLELLAIGIHWNSKFNDIFSNQNREILATCLIHAVV